MRWRTRFKRVSGAKYFVFVSSRFAQFEYFYTLFEESVFIFQFVNDEILG